MRKMLHDSRREAGLTQEQLAVIVGIERTVYNRIERGTRNPDVEVALAIAIALGKKVEDIFLSNHVLKQHQGDLDNSHHTHVLPRTG